MGKRKQAGKSLSYEERQDIANVVRNQIRNLKIQEITEIKKLQIMLNLFEQHGREFDQNIQISDLGRALQVKLYNSKSRSCSVILKRPTD